MYFKLSKALVVAVLSAVTCSAVSVMPRYENENNTPTISEKGGDAQVNNGAMNVRMTDVCIQGKNDPETCWERRIQNHTLYPYIDSQDGEPMGGDTAQAIARVAYKWFEYFDVGPLNRDTAMYIITGEMVNTSVPFNKTIWNDDPNDTRFTFAYDIVDIEGMCKDAIQQLECVGDPGQTVVDNRHGSNICVEVRLIPDAKYPGDICHPTDINASSKPVGGAC